MKEFIKERSKRLGIDLIGFTDILQFAYLNKYLKNRILKNYDCEFENNDLSKRLNVKEYFPSCKSIITACFPYAKGYKYKRSKNTGLISVSSFGNDYHKKIYNKLELLAEEINNYNQINYKICVDTSPLLDREICKNSGIGNYGKNSLLINEKYGSFIFLGYILLDKKIDNIRNHLENVDLCKDCSICINSCPNNAIKENNEIDTKRCISYLTQTKDYIPIEYRPKMGNSIYGCDVCQIVCPKNSHIVEADTNLDYSDLSVDLKELITITNKQFNIKYGHTAGSWRGKNIWKRNAIIAAANQECTELKQLISNELDNQSQMIKIYAAWSIMKLDRKNGKDILKSKLKYEENNVKKEYELLLEKLS